MGFWSRWIGRPLRATDSGLYDLLGRGETWAGEPVSVQGALNLSAYWACVRITAQTVASLSFDIMEKGKDGVKVKASGHWLQGLLDESPNADQTAIEFWEGRVLGLCTTGNGFGEKSYVGRRIVAINRMPNDTVVIRKEDGSLEYRFVDRGKEEKLPEEKVFHIKGFGDGDVGMSPVEYARQTLSLTIATERAVGQGFSRGQRAKGFFVMPPGAKPLTAEQRADAKKSLVDANAGPAAPWAGILEGGVDWKSISLSNRDAELILNRRFNVEEVCRWLGTPPIIIGHAGEGQTMWGTGVGVVMQAWYTLGLRPLFKRIEQAVAKRLLTPEERQRFSLRINYEDLLRTDSAARAAFYVAMLAAGVMTINEVRRLEGLSPVAGGDVPRMQAQNIPITATTSVSALMNHLQSLIGHNGGPPLGVDA
ncbi:phage portal protein, HK97 family [Bosea lupini]|uniref:Phage portal protein, HK97 family n=1 Tax=Bosea lupini TaxID=1036779 RepID=A0A1H8AF62_9HYPH|nr:phage portal protein [Bosea lupini]SEM69183.1 phage portal protein, HK97 family [Bosea lupini]